MPDPICATAVKQADLAPEVQLQEHQQRVADRVSGEDPRLLVYHGLGSGKSLSAIAAAEAAKKVSGGDYGVVVPASLRGNFQKEIKKFTRNSDPEILSYTALGMGKNFKHQPETLIMDEAARLRNPNAAMTRAALQNAGRAKRLLLLTGTPITNEPKDLASLISIIRNEKYDPAQFDKDFVGEKRVWPSFWGFLQGARAGVKPVMKNGPKLRELLKGHVDYQPSKTPEGVNVNEETVNVPLSKEQQRIQKALRTQIPPGFLWKLDREFPLSREELAKLNSFMTGLRQVSLSTQPFRADKDPLKAFGQSAKLQEAFKRLRTTLDEDPRKKAIIYSNFVDAGLSPYAAGLAANKIPYGIFHGGIPTKARQEALKNYNEGKLRALLIGPAGAEGISTKGTSLIQLLDPYWNESRLQQAQGRGLRFDSHEGLPEDLKNVAVQRYLSTSEEPGLVGKYLLGKRRQRTGDEVIQHMAAEKEKLNEEFRKILREVGTEKSEKAAAGPVFPPFGQKPLKPATAAPPFQPWMRNMGKPTPTPEPQEQFTNQHYKPPRPPMGNGTMPGSYKMPPAPQPVTPKVPTLSPTLATGQTPTNNPTTNAWQHWINRNYVGDSRFNAHKAINEHLNQTPGSRDQYQTITDNMFTRAKAQARTPFEATQSNRPLAQSYVAKGFMLDKPKLSVGDSEQFIGQKRPLGAALAAGLGRAAGVAPSTMAALSGGRTMYAPSMTRGIVGTHEMEHVNQQHAPETLFPPDDAPYIPSTARAEPAAVMNEMVHATDAAHQATGKPVDGRFALSENYQPDLEWMRRQALQHGLANMGPAGTGSKTMQELLNTPEGQAWQRMQLRDMPKTVPQGDPVLSAVGNASRFADRIMRNVTNPAHKPGADQ